MRLLRRAPSDAANPNSGFSLTEFFAPSVLPSYAILSHRWGTEEVTLKDLESDVADTRDGYKKLEFCARQAADDDIDYFWVDTCCIDKANHTELSEAINSMFKWYKNAAKCYVYLPDVPSKSQRKDEAQWKLAFQQSEWFTRGWTLQELIAPKVVEFFSAKGEKFGDKQSLAQEIHLATKIPIRALGGDLSKFGIEERMSWAYSRQTTKEEDFAYCLLGIFGVHMPLIYGEGRDGAIARLRETFRNAYAEDRECHQTFKTSSYEQYKDRNPLRMPDTCQWVLSHSKFRDWRAEQNFALLWISADPGCGKSVLCRSLIDQDLYDCSQSTICYFFFKDNSEQDSLAIALCAILHQLFDQQPHLLRYASSAWDKNGAKLQSETQELWRIFSDATADQSAEPVICLFDALDECEDADRRLLIQALCRMQQRRDGATVCKLKILVTSRPYDNVQRWFSQITAQWPQIRLRGEDENEKIHQEIDLVIKQRVQDLATDFDLSTVVLQDLQKQLLQMQHRTYLWLHLAIEEIRVMYRDTIFSRNIKIESLPSSVQEAYERVLEKISERQKHFALKVLLIIVGARRPLDITEMSAALGAAHASEYGLTQIDHINISHLEKAIREQCGLFVYIQDSQLFLIHQTAKEFLMADDGPAHGSSWRSSLQSEQVEAEMARICVVHLHIQIKSDHNAGNSVIRTERAQSTVSNYIGSRRFYDYCVKYWESHIRDFTLQKASGLIPKVLKIYQTNSILDDWFPSPAEMQNYEDFPRPNVGHVAARFGQVIILEELWTVGSLILEARDSTRKTALHWAADRGHSNAVEWLLNKGADVDTVNRWGNYALQTASENGHERVVQILLDKGADVNARGGEYGNALKAASENGHERVVQILLDKGADVNARGGFHGNALQAASRNGHERVVQILLDKGADVNARGGEYGNALQAALVTGNERVMLILLDKGADVNARGGEHGNVVRAVLAGGHQQLVSYLKRRHATAFFAEYSQMLYSASSNGRELTVRRLLDRGADPNAFHGKLGSSLQAALHHGHLGVAAILKANGAR